MIKVVQGSRDKRNLFSSCCVASSLCRYSMGWYLADLKICTSRRPRAKGEGFSARDCTARTWHSSPHRRSPSQGREAGFMYPQPGAGAPAGPGLGHLIAIKKMSTQARTSERPTDTENNNQPKVLLISQVKDGTASGRGSQAEALTQNGRSGRPF